VPAILRVFADEGQLFQQNPTAAGVLLPTLAGDRKCVPGSLFGTHLRDGQVRDVRPLFLAKEYVCIQLGVQLVHARRRLDPDEDGGRNRNKCLHRAQGYFKGLLFSTHALEKLNGRAFIAAQRTRGQNCEMGRELSAGGFRMQIPAQALDEFSCRAFHISNQRVSRTLHTGVELYRDASQAAIEAFGPSQF
jgi:hypothetical protein